MNLKERAKLFYQNHIITEEMRETKEIQKQLEETQKFLTKNLWDILNISSDSIKFDKDEALVEDLIFVKVKTRKDFQSVADFYLHLKLPNACYKCQKDVFTLITSFVDLGEILSNNSPICHRCSYAGMTVTYSSTPSLEQRVTKLEEKLHD
jgi:seryl-tRNA synthetase